MRSWYYPATLCSYWLNILMYFYILMSHDTIHTLVRAPLDGLPGCEANIAASGSAAAVRGGL